MYKDVKNDNKITGHRVHGKYLKEWILGLFFSTEFAVQYLEKCLSFWKLAAVIVALFMYVIYHCH